MLISGVSIGPAAWVFRVSAFLLVVGAALIALSLTDYPGANRDMFELVGAVMTPLALLANFWAIAVKELHADRAIKEATTRATQAAADLEEERVRRLELEASLAPRRLTASQRAAIVMGLGRVAPLSVALIQVADPEAQAFAGVLLAALQEAGHNAFMAATKMNAAPRFGLEVTSVSNSAVHHQFANILKLADGNATFCLVPAFGPWSPPGTEIEVYVNFKA